MNNVARVGAFLQKSWWVFASVLVLWLAAYSYARQANEAAFNALFRAELAGKIRTLARQNHGFSVAVELDDHRRYRFFPAKQQGGAAGFLATAAIGDSLRKKPASDTLVLLKSGRRVRYAFEKVLD